jgi:hypothetical protein
VLRRLDERIARIGREKQAAIDAQDFERAATLRHQERELLEQRDAEHRRQPAAAEPPRPAADGAELDRLHQVIDNLQAQLRRHGIEPDPQGEGEASPESKGRAGPESKGEASPESKGRAGPESKGEASPEGNGEADAPANGSAPGGGAG